MRFRFFLCCLRSPAVISVEGSEQYGRTYIVPDMLAHIINLLADPEGKQEVRTTPIRGRGKRTSHPRLSLQCSA